MVSALALPKMNRRNETLFVIGILSVLAMIGIGIMLFVNPTVFANGAEEKATTVIEAILAVVKNIVQIVGIILAVVGVVKLVMAHVNDQGPEQKTAAVMIAAAIVLIILPSILDTLNVASWFEQAQPGG